MRMWLVALLAGVLWSGGTWGAADTGAKAAVEQTSQQMLEALRANREALRRDPGGIYGLVEEIVLPRFDFETMAQWVLGKYWRTASEDERRRFTEEFRTLLVRTYATALLEYSDEEIVFPASAASGAGDEATVRSEIRIPGELPVPMTYSMHLKDGEWRVYDVTIDGVSLVTSYRGSFATDIRKQGMGPFIERLARRNAEGGAPR